ncbi:hypothetical protein AYO21_03343 [Fonsecaea monophora]|uniref:Ketoreductase domain-containing protein n=1 Tax=Fonsecaea monophora TaxID=254056 RepID=A0A177FE11_9EURO|nr:hypothetical protein AYO21_03343 [Fonsecaea monophora]OAG42467.1 hypothetical protein AYO21_03343 [Fonsecaea monophora]
MAGIPNFESLFRLDGKVALITGGSRGIGLYIASGFLQAGAKEVILTARKEDGLKEAVAQLNALPNIQGRASYIVANVSRIEGIEKLVEETKSRLSDGKLHILVNNAAASWGGPYEDFDDWKIAKTLDVNVRGVFNLTRKMIPLLAAAGTHDDPARVLIVSSVGGIAVLHTGSDGAIAYSISKAAAHHLGRNLAIELVNKNITTNVIAPGWYPTRLASPAIEKFGGEEVAANDNPMKRLGKPEDMAGVAVYLASRAGTYVNGEDISVDGGKRLMMGSYASPLSEPKSKL